MLAPWPRPSSYPKASGASCLPLSASLPVSYPQNIRVWDLQEYICLQSFCGRLFALGNCPITSAYLQKSDNSLICCTYSVSAGQEEAALRPHTAGGPCGGV